MTVVPPGLLPTQHDLDGLCEPLVSVPMRRRPSRSGSSQPMLTEVGPRTRALWVEGGPPVVSLADAAAPGSYISILAIRISYNSFLRNWLKLRCSPDPENSQTVQFALWKLVQKGRFGLNNSSCSGKAHRGAPGGVSALCPRRAPDVRHVTDQE